MNKLFLGILILLAFLVVGCTPAQETEQVQEGPQADEPRFNIALMSFPTSNNVNEPLNIRWNVDASTQTIITHTAVHYSYTSNSGDLGLEVTPQQSGYETLTKEFASGEFNIPNTFSTEITPDQIGTLYFRAHAIIDGKNYWTDEKAITVNEVSEVSEEPKTAAVKEFSVEGDDRGLYPDTLTVNKGDNVKITFKVREEKVYFGGLDFRSDVWGDTGKVLPGSTTTVEFTAEETFSYTSYWPASNRLKATGQIIVM